MSEQLELDYQEYRADRFRCPGCEVPTGDGRWCSACQPTMSELVVPCAHCGGMFRRPEGNPLFTHGFSHCDDHSPQRACDPMLDALSGLVDDSYAMMDQPVSPQLQPPDFRCIHCEATKREGRLVSPHAEFCPVGVGEAALLSAAHESDCVRDLVEMYDRVLNRCEQADAEIARLQERIAVLEPPARSYNRTLARAERAERECHDLVARIESSDLTTALARIIGFERTLEFVNSTASNVSLELRAEIARLQHETEARRDGIE